MRDVRRCTCGHAEYLHINDAGRCLACSARDTGPSRACLGFDPAPAPAPSPLAMLATDLLDHGQASCPLIWHGHATETEAADRARHRLRRAARRAGVRITTATGWQSVYATVISGRPHQGAS